MITVDKFMAQNKAKGKASLLASFEKDILKLRNNGYTLEQIMEFLKLNNVTISKTSLYSFIKSRQLNPKVLDQAKQSPGNTESIEPKDIKMEKSQNDELSSRPNWASKVPLSEII